MPLFSFLNSKRDKKSSNGTQANTDVSSGSRASVVSDPDDSESQWESVSQMTHSQYHGSDVNGDSTPSSSRMKLAFRRKASASPVAPTSPTRPQTGSNQTRSSLEASKYLLPPAKSSVFGSHSDSQTFSTTSLQSTARTAPDTSNYQDMLRETRSEAPKTPKKSGGLLSWARERTKSRPSSPPPIPVDSFNLKAFRHVRPESPSPQPDRPPSSLDMDLPPPPARPRPRGDSTASDSSQRISVAAFREAQAKRSATNSPVPSFRPPSAADTLMPTRSSQGNMGRATPPPAGRRPTAPTISINSSESSESASEDGESEDDGTPGQQTGRPRKRTITKRTATGNESLEEPKTAPLQRPVMPLQSRSASPQLVASSSRPPSSMSAYQKSVGSVSTSALSSSGPIKRPAPTRRISSDSDSSNSSSDSDSDDAPLASLIQPRRPGSAASVASNPRSRVPAKPLIDIKTLISDRTGFSSSPEPESASRSMTRGNTVDGEVADLSGLAKLAQLAREEEAKMKAAEASAQSMQLEPEPEPKPKPQVQPAKKTSKSTHRYSTSDVITVPERVIIPPPRSSSRGPDFVLRSAQAGSSVIPTATSNKVPVSTVVPRSEEDDGTDDMMLALRFMMPKDESAPPAPASPPAQMSIADTESLPVPPSLDDEKRIVPTPIRQRVPPSSFSVTSRPQHRTQQSSVSTITAFSQSTSTLASGAPSTAPTSSSVSMAPQSTSPRLGRRRSSSMVNTPANPNHSDSESESESSSSSSSSSPPPLKTPASTTRPQMSSSKSTHTSSFKPPPPVNKTSSTPNISRRTRSRSSTLISQIPDSAPLNPETRKQALPAAAKPFSTTSRPGTLVSMIPATPASPSSMKPKPFAGNAMRRESPASSTGDSSSGRVPLTPRDGSDIGVQDEWLQLEREKRDRKRRSASFGDPSELERLGIPRGREWSDKAETHAEGENRRRDRRRSEAKAAIELGNVINGRGPIDESEDEDSHNLMGQPMGPMNPMMNSMMNPMMAMGGAMNFSPSSGAPRWAPWMQQGQGSPTMMQPNQFGQDATFLAAHQQAMIIAKQTYQMAVAQQAIAAAGDEWERSSNVSGFPGAQGFGGSAYGGSVYGGGGGGGSVYGGGGGGSVYGGSVSSMPMNPNMGMLGMGGYGGMGMGMGLPNAWPNGLTVPSAPRSAYGGFGGAQSDYGGGSGGGGWGSRSAYGESLGPSPNDRSSRAFSSAPMPNLQQQQQQQQSYFASPPRSGGGRDRKAEPSGHSNRAEAGSGSSGQRNNRPAPRQRTLTAPSSSQPPAQHSSKKSRGASPPPSSWSRFQPGT